MEEEKIKKFPSESIQSEEEETRDDAEMAEEEPSKYDSALMSDSKSSISSTAFSRTETPDEQTYGLPIDTIKTKHEDDPEKLKKDIAARGIIVPSQKLSEHSSLRGSLMSTALVSERMSENDLNQDIPDSEESIIPLEPAANVDTDLIDSRPSSASTSLSVEVPLKVEQTDSESEQKLSSHSPELVRVGERETSFISRQGNITVELSSTCTQTESSWLKDLEFYEEISHFRPEWIDEMKAIKQRKESKSSSGSAKVTFFKRRKKKSGTEPRSAASPYAEKRVRSRIDADEKIEKEEEEVKEEEKLSRETSFQQSRQSFPSPSPQTPIREDDMLYRPPTVEMSSESSSEEEYEYSPDESTFIPSIGPPSILQYIKESQQPPMMKEEADSRDEALGSENLRRSLFSGPCMFCKKEILPFPTEEEIENTDLKSSDLFCCSQYKNYIKLELANNKSFMRDELIDIKPHPPFGTKAARKAAKERAAERARQREMDRQKAAGASAAANQNFYACASFGHCLYPVNNHHHHCPSSSSSSKSVSLSATVSSSSSSHHHLQYHLQGIIIIHHNQYHQ
ncbi:uncharacterized protein LOC116291893 [Actinia tenebrosa]|uniref:Uncharacterized protein LOC116291893 n=1 Tax=Actinia tenebrosa TaxID=6105 RepID=A0A6P8HGL9_ACTTE|nr:uncharacterized protein LOC116291893 [Actinia tenebrosa]